MAGELFHFRHGRCVCTGVETCAAFMARMSRQELDGFERSWAATMTEWMDGNVQLGRGVHWAEGIPALRFYAAHGGREDEVI